MSTTVLAQQEATALVARVLDAVDLRLIEYRAMQ